MGRLASTEWVIPVVLALLLASPRTSHSGEEPPPIGDSDYPELIGPDEEGGDYESDMVELDVFVELDIDDEFAFLMEDAGIVESAARHKQEIGMSPSAITVITRQDIEASGATTIPDLLRLVPGMNVVVSNPFFLAITTRLYWTEENNHLMILIDGREANFDPLGFTPWAAQPILLEDIERIEVIRGPGSSLYGANAMAGVVTITTRDIPQNTSAWVHADAGEEGRLITGLRASTRIGNWGLSLGGGTYFSGNPLQPQESTKEVWKFRSVAEYRWSDTERFLADMSLSRTWGPMASPMGTVECDFHPNMLRLAYESEKLNAHVYYTYSFARAEIKTPLEYSQIRLALFKPAPIESHVVDGQVQWTLPTFWEPLLLIGGGGTRFAWMSSDTMLDADTFDDPASPNYHEPGITHWELRGGVFIHAEYAPTDWVTVTGGTRFDYNTQTGAFLSPRLASVFQPVAGQFIRVGIARSFRKPAFMETVAHLMVDFPPDSPITGPGQDKFQEFMTRVGGSDQLENEELLAFEAGYLGQFLDNQLTIGLDLYYNIHTNITQMNSQILEDTRGLPDLELSSFMFENIGSAMDILGSELYVRYSPSRYLSLLASWSHRQVHMRDEDSPPMSNPHNQITLGGRFGTESGLVGSLYGFSRSEMWYRAVENPAGLLQPLLGKHADHVVVVLSKLGWKFDAGGHFDVETGVKLQLPISPFSPPYFRFYECGGGVTPQGKIYGSVPLARIVTAYVEGSF